MTNEDMIRLAREAGWKYADGDDGYAPLWEFGQLVAAAEREACIRDCDSVDLAGADDCIAAIRARGQS